MDLQRLVHDRVPFRARGSAPLAVFGQRQIQRIEQRDNFLARRQMREVRPRAECFLIEVIKCSQPAREELSIDDALGKALDTPEAHATIR